MVANALLFPISSQYLHGFSATTSNYKLDVHAYGINTKSASSWRLQVKANANQLPSKKTKSCPNLDPFRFGRLMVEDGSIFRQTFQIRSYETAGPDQKASIETIMDQFQETILNYTKAVGIMGDGYDSAPKLWENLIWVVTSMQVEVDRYPIWGDVVQIDIVYMTLSGKNCVRCHWLLCDCKTKEILIRGSSNVALMSKVTRRLSKLPDEIRAILDEYLVDICTPPTRIIVKDTCRKLDETTADHVCTGLMPRWSDLDVNHHVNNVKYIRWILESTPEAIVMNYELATMSLEYLRECGKDCVLQSLTSQLGTDHTHAVDCQHVLRLQNGGVITKAWTRWCPKHGKIIRQD